MELTGMVTEHMASLPPLPPLSTYARGRRCRRLLAFHVDADMITHTGR
jgi:hypothetical protein